MLQFFTIYWKVITTILALAGFFITIVKLISNSYAIRKLQDNDLQHLSKNLEEHKQEYKEFKTKSEEEYKEFKTKSEKEDKEFKKEIRDELHQINLGMLRVERKVIKLETKDEIKNKKA